MRTMPKILLTAILLVAIPVTAMACLWDYDTLRMERDRFPNTLELITGKFLRHSKEFYEWRIQDRLGKIAKDPDHIEYYDDLAVAYEKTGQHGLAIEWILKKEKIKPGLYETYSNLGTFHILAGELEQGLPWIDKALAINPDAHFGRERYQKWLVEYALKRKKDGKVSLPLRDNKSLSNHPEGSFVQFLEQKLGVQHLSPEEVRKAIQGILGMMRFANHENPLLLEILGDLLFNTFRGEAWDAKRLAAFAYLKASQVMPDPKAKADYENLSQRALHMQTSGPGDSNQMPMELLVKEFHNLQADADTWYAQLKENEIGWIRDGKNADEEFDRLYAKEPVVRNGEKTRGRALVRWMDARVAVLALVLIGVLLLIFLGNRNRA